jgi:hypothetical protein
MSFKRGTMMTALKPPMPREMTPDNFRYGGPTNSLKYPDDLTEGSVWGASGVTATEPSTGVFRLTKGAAAFQYIVQNMGNWFPSWGATYSFVCEMKAGSLDRCYVDMSVDTAGTNNDSEVISGNASIATNRLVSDLDSEWSKIRITGTAKGWVSSAQVVLYIDWDAADAGYIDVRNCQVILGDQYTDKPRPTNQEAAWPMMAYRPMWRKTKDGGARFFIQDGAVSSELVANPGFETAGGGGADIWAS